MTTASSSSSSSSSATPPRRKANSHSQASPAAQTPEVTKQLKAIVSAKKQSKRKTSNTTSDSIDYWSYAVLLVIVLITIFTYPTDWSIDSKVSVHHVWYNGWITAIATGVGVLPFFFLSSEPNKFWMGISNAIAGGMMIAASFSLVQEATQYDGEDFGILAMFPKMFHIAVHSQVRTFFGFVIGVVFILVTKKVLDAFEDMKVVDIGGASTQRMLLIVIVMTLHSLTEGIGIGVSFGGKSGMKLGHFISLSLAVHNIPEGLAVGLVMTSRKVSCIRTVLWAIFTSIPQPLFAVPAYLFIERFAPLLPGGLGFAAGAMSYVAIFELLSEATEDTSLITTAIAGSISCMMMTMIQEALKQAV